MVAERRDAGTWLGLAVRRSSWRLAEGATQAEALVTADDSALTRFANSEIHQNVAETNAQLNLRFVVGRRVGVASTGRLDREGLRAVAEAAGRIARNVEENDEFVSLPGPAPADPGPAGRVRRRDRRGVARAPGRGRPRGHRRHRRRPA